jgi:hypothetical protein
MLTPIPGLRDTLVCRTASETYQRHRDAGNGACRACGEPMPCPSRRHATSVIVAAGEHPDPGRTQQLPVAGDLPQPAPRRAEPQPELSAPAATPAYTGYRLGGRGRPGSPDGYFYDRDG